MVAAKNEVISISEEGSIKAMLSDKFTDHMKDKKVRRMETVGEDVYFILDDMVLQKSGDTTILFYSGHVDKLDCGASHIIMKTDNGYMAQGSNNNGQLCIPGLTKARTPTASPLLDALPIDKIFVGGWHNYARLQDGSFVGWGYNGAGRLGDGVSTSDAFTPIALSHHLLGIETLACAGWYTLGLTYSGDVSDTAQLTTKVYAWGESAAYGMAVKNVGLKTPTLIMKDMHVINIFTGAFAETNFAQTRDGKMYVWGSNSRNAYFGKLAVKETYTSRHEESDRYHVVKKPTLFPPLCNLPIRDFFVGNASCFLTLETRKKHKQFKIDTSAFGDVKIQCL